VERLENETRVLAQKLLDTSVSLHRREEELYDVKQAMADKANATLQREEETKT
jgi:hypothetical protein